METSSTFARKSPRIRCQLPVQIKREAEAPEAAEPVMAQAVDVSRGGMRVRAPLWLAVGEPLVCTLPLDGSDARLRGHVAWSDPDDHAAGIGISFSELSRDDVRRLESVVRATLPNAEPVELRFEGLPAAVRGRAITLRGGIRLATTLPILSRDAGVRFRYPGDAHVYAGRVANVGIRESEGAHILEVDVSIAAADRPRFRRHARFGRRPVASAPHTAALHARRLTEPLWQPRRATFAGDSGAAAEPGRAPRKASPTRGRGWLASALAAAALVGTLWLAFAANPGTADRVPHTPTAAAPASAGTPSTSVPPQPIADQTIAGSAGLNRSAPEDALDTSEPATDAQGLPAADPVMATSVVHVVEYGPRSEVSLPFEGSLEGLTSTRWTAPDAWVLRFPVGRTPLPDGTHRLGSGPVRSLQVERTADGLTLRLVLRTRTLSPQLSQQPGRLVLALSRAR